MDVLRVFFTSLLIAELVIVGLAVKTIATIVVKPTGSKSGMVLSALFAVFILLVGAGAAAVTLGLVIPDQWGKNAYWPLLLSAYGASVAVPILFVRLKSRKEELTKPSEICPLPDQPGVRPEAHLPDKLRAWPQPGLEAGLKAIRNRRMEYAKRVTLVLLVIGIPLTLIAGSKYGLPAFGGAAFVILLLVKHSYENVGSVCEVEYRTLPGANDASGRHRCVYCGKPGVYRQGAYASSSTWHQCTGCRKHLFVD